MARLNSMPMGREVIKSIEQAQASIQKLSDAHQRMADRAVQAARGMELVGGASKLTTTELAEMNRVAVKGIDAFKALGQDVPASLTKMAAETQKVTTAGKGFASFLGQANGLLGAFGVSLSIGAVVGFGKSLLDMADSIQKVSDRTGLSTKEVQEFQYVAGQSGNTIDEMTGALGQLQNRLVSGDKGAVGAVKALGINFKTLIDASPADQMETIAAAIAKVPDPAQRTAVAMDLFGKSGAAILPTLTADFARLRKEAPLMSDATVKALDSAGDQLARFGTQVKVWAAESYNLAGRAFDALIKGAYLAAAAFTDVVVKIASLASKIPGASKALTMLGADVATLTKDAQWFRDAAAAMSARTDAVAASATKAAPKLKLFNAETEKSAKSAEQAKEKFEQLTERVHGLEAGIAAVPDALQKIGRGYDESKLSPLAAAIGKVEENAHIANFGFKGMTDELTKVGFAAGKTTDELDRFSRFDWQGPILQKVSGLGASMMAVFKNIPQMVASAFTGGGGIFGALQGIGSQIGSVIGKNLGERIRSLGDMAGPIGAAIGSLAGPIIGFFGKVFSGGAEHAINPIRQAFINAAGGLGALNTKAAQAGVTLKAVLDAKNPKQYQKAIEDLNAALEFQANSVATLDETVKRYGFSIEELGPAMQRQELDKQAQGLFKDWEVLNAAGISTVAITAKMAEGVNEYVKRAITMGVEVPAAMKPMLQSMIDQGLLTDAAGNKIGNLEDSGITFAQTMSEGFKSVVDSVKGLADAITRSLGGAIAGLPTHKNIDIGFNVAPVQIPHMPETEHLATGGLVTSHGVQQFASGGRVLPFLRRGRDTVPAMLTPGEIVLNESQQRAVAGAIGGGGISTARLEAQNEEILRWIQHERIHSNANIQRIVRSTVQTVGGRR